jgi:hypothetical protein
MPTGYFQKQLKKEKKILTETVSELAASKKTALQLKTT